MSEVRRDGYNYHNTYVESVEWQRDKAYARAEKAERELEMVGKKHQLALEAAWGERNAAEARAEKAEREVATLAMELRASKTHGTEMFDKAVDQMNRAEKAERDAAKWRDRALDLDHKRCVAADRAEKLAAALRFYADPQSYGISGGSCQRVISDAGRIAARALAETEGEKRVEG